jgi:hypothetical protein
VVTRAKPEPRGLQGAIDGSYLNGIAAISPTDMTTTGQVAETAGGALPILIHWNGTRWTTASAPNPGAAGSVTNLSAITGSPATGFWLIGLYDSGSRTHSYALHRAG